MYGPVRGTIVKHSPYMAGEDFHQKVDIENAVIVVREFLSY